MSVVTKFLLTILIFMYLSETPLAEQRQQCVPSSCGHIHNISYPFRLKSDPKHCGLENYELSCEGDHTLLTIPPHDWHGSLNYYVQAINYANSTIRLVDPGIREQVICSLPQNWITTLFDFDSYIFKMPEFVYLTVPITLFSCPFALNSPDFVEITNCLNRSYASNVSSDSFKGHTYATMAELSPSDLKVGCTVDLISMTSWRNKDANANISILSLHNALAYGFELSWFRQVYCGKCANSMICEGENSSDVHCLDLTCEDHYFRFFKLLIVGDFAAIIPWILPIAETPLAEQRQQCVPSSCGHIHNISYPFRLKSDPKHCGLENYELSCEGDRAIITIRYGVHIPLNYYVQAINYDNSTIRLTDPGIREQVICSLPQNSITTLVGFDSQIYTITDFVKLTVPITLFSCPFAINSPVFVEITSCLNRSYASNVSSDSFKGHTYATMAELSPSDLKVGCTVDLISMTSWRIQDANANISILSLHNALAYGFELSWFQHVHCGKCANSCEGKNSSDVRCVDYNCKTYNFRFFKSSCAIIPWILPIAGLIIVPRVILFPCIVVLLMIELRRRHLSIYDAIESFLHGENNFAPIRYSNSNIRKMTRNFKEKLGQGGYGSVYKGKLQSGPSVAVKILSKPKADGQDFINEVATIGRIHHVNIVQLIGYCAERCKRALVYDFMPNGSLEKYITPREGGAELLSWERKFETALGVARGIEYLHRGCDIQILHFDIKPHNILLDENFIPKLSDFGLAKSYPTDKSIVTLTAARGTIGYVAPELINRSIGPISYKADVYSFGMLLIDIVGLKTNSAAREDMLSQYFPHWIYDQLDNGKEIEVLDETHDDVKKLTLVSLWCIQMNPLDRPSMTKVVEMLEGELQALQTPPRPSESREPCSLEFNLISSSISSTESVKLLESCSDSAKIDVIVA